jgi:hypothetical protein
MIHELKTWPEYYRDVTLGIKNFEVRKTDRLFCIGDKLVLKEFDPDTGYTGRSCEREITYILHGGQFGIEIGYCVMGLKRAI